LPTIGAAGVPGRSPKAPPPIRIVALTLRYALPKIPTTWRTPSIGATHAVQTTVGPELDPRVPTLAEESRQEKFVRLVRSVPQVLRLRAVNVWEADAETVATRGLTRIEPSEVLEHGADAELGSNPVRGTAAPGPCISAEAVRMEDGDTGARAVTIKKRAESVTIQVLGRR